MLLDHFPVLSRQKNHRNGPRLKVLLILQIPICSNEDPEAFSFSPSNQFSVLQAVPPHKDSSEGFVMLEDQSQFVGEVFVE